MPDTKGSQDRSVRIGGNVTGSAIIAGDRNVVTLHYEKISLPPAASVDMHAELDALREVLMRLETPDRKKIKNALSEAKEEMTKAAPDKDEVGTALNRALSYAQKAEGFARAIETLKPHVGNAAAWFGSNWHKILAVVGLAV